MRQIINQGIKKGIAVGLMAIMAMITPMQELRPIGASVGTPTVAKAAESDKAPYLGEVRLAVDKNADKAKQILKDAGYEVLDQDLNKDAGTIWNKYGEQAVYLGFKRTADEDKAIRDMKVMNMLGKYSYSDLEAWVKKNRADAEEKVAPILTALEEYRKLLSSDTNDVMAKKVDSVLKYIREDDSGKNLAELFSGKCDEKTLVKILVEGNQSMVIEVIRALTSACEMPDSTWLERLSGLSKSKLFDKYAKDIYGKTSLTGLQKEKVDQFMSADLDETARKLLEKWDDIRGILIDPENEGTADEVLREKVSDSEFAEAYMETQDEMVRLQNSIIVNKLKSIPYSGKTMADYFKTKKSVFVKDIKKLYPVAAALSPGQRAMLDFIDAGDLVQNCLSRMEYRSTEKTPSGDVINDLESELKETSIYEGVDRAMFQDGAAMTSRSVVNMKSAGNDSSLAEGLFIGMKIGFFVSSVLALTSYFVYSDIPYLKKEIESVLDLLGKWTEELEALNPDYPFDNEYKDILRGKIANGYEKYAELDKAYKEAPTTAKFFLIASIVMAIISTAAYVIGKIDESNVKQLPIPDVMVDFEVESKASRYVSYRVAKDGTGNGDLNGRAAKQWLALYTATDAAVGEPILADSLMTVKGNKGERCPKEGYQPLTLFGVGSVLNLVDPSYVFDGGAEGIYMWFKKGTISKGIENDIADDRAEVTGSNIGGNNNVFFMLVGGVLGIVVGLFMGLFIKRKKEEKNA